MIGQALWEDENNESDGDDINQFLLQVSADRCRRLDCTRFSGISITLVSFASPTQK